MYTWEGACKKEKVGEEGSEREREREGGTNQTAKVCDNLVANLLKGFMGNL